MSETEKLKVMGDRLAAFLWLCRERYAMRLRKEAGQPRPWTTDPLLNKYHFCNVHRKADKTSRVIQELICAQPDFHGRLSAAILGRLINRAGTIVSCWEVREDPGSLVVRMREKGVNTNAYRLNTPKGLNNLEGLAELIVEPRASLSERLERSTSLRQAHSEINKEPFIRGFVGYQIVLDLFDTGSWPEGFDGDWALAGPGACRGMMWLMGMVMDYDWTSAGFRADKGVFLQRMVPLMKQLTAVIGEDWPRDWEPFSVHETEFMLCELDKWVRKQEATKPSGRIYKGETK